MNLGSKNENSLEWTVVWKGWFSSAILLWHMLLFYSKEYTWFEVIVSFIEDRSGKIPYKNISYIF